MMIVEEVKGLQLGYTQLPLTAAWISGLRSGTDLKRVPVSSQRDWLDAPVMKTREKLLPTGTSREKGSI